jgi:hypothetical protein
MHADPSISIICALISHLCPCLVKPFVVFKADLRPQDQELLNKEVDMCQSCCRQLTQLMDKPENGTLEQIRQSAETTAKISRPPNM